jgi:hypothetical protein
VNEYREGKVKSTPTRGVKQFLKPDAYKQSERGSPKVSHGCERSEPAPCAGGFGLARMAPSKDGLAFGEPRDGVPLV